MTQPRSPFRTAPVSILAAVALLVPALALCAPWVDPEPGLTSREFLVFLHQVLFVFWLGPDFGVYLWSSKVANPALSVPQRLAAARIMGVIDLLPRIAMSLMLTVGGLLSEYVGLEHPAWQLAGIILLGPVWLTLVLLVFFRQGTAFGATLARLDVWFRWALMAGIIVSVSWSTLTGRLAEAPWVGWKLLIFAALLFIGAMMRLQIRPFIEGVRALATTGSSDTVNAAMAASLGRTKLWVMAMWSGLLLAGLLGVLQPGSPG